MKEDFLTGFLIREELTPYLNSLINEGKPFILGFLDLNHFKKYNDKYGHPFGDEVLKYTASTFRLTFSQKTKIFRYGGDEFVIVFPESTRRYVNTIFKVCNRNLRDRPFLFNNKLFNITVSYGVVNYPSDGKDVKILIEKADKAMYLSKKRGEGVITDYMRMKFVGNFIFPRKFIILFGILIGVFYFIKSNAVNSIQSYLDWQRLNEMKNISVSEPYVSKVMLKGGEILKGYVVFSDQNSLMLKIVADKEEGFIIIDKSLVLEVR